MCDKKQHYGMDKMKTGEHIIYPNLHEAAVVMIKYREEMLRRYGAAVEMNYVKAKSCFPALFLLKI